jgi:hypothetical protein
MKRPLRRGRIAVAAWLLAACAAPPTSQSAIEPTLGHHQPLPTASNDAAPTDAEQPHHDHASEEAVADSSMLPTAEDEALCRHIVQLVQSESQDRASAEQTNELLVSCAFALAHDRRRMGTEEFERRAACMLAATTVADFAACAPAPAPSDPP